ncbi:glycerol-3-phosphate 2-O-acyltransferase 6 [Iris pallida]|uniref:Glycerol-3-phosphate 2-O-acyltransferase 6 n=1 Tax=Iris pallida TaxID=29817 RepID=A0AAX6G222_IRIPA|nr:glycerol-3-phosphate 2-O-acyltransferase 6 [Iris pallida]
MDNNNNMSIVSRLEGALLISRDPYPYLMLVAFEAGGPLRALLLLLLSPALWFLDLLRLEDASLRLMIFVSTAGLRTADVKAVAKANLQKFFLEDLRESAYGLFSRCRGRRVVVTRLPRIMVEPFLREYLDVDHVIGTELRTTATGGRCAGLVASKGVMGGPLELEALRESMRDWEEEEIDVGLGDGLRDHPFMSLCREPHLISPEEKPSALPRRDYPRPLIFHDGRLVKAPTALESVAVAVWLPPSILIAVSRVLVGTLLPFKLIPMACAATGLRIRAQFPNNSTTLAAGAATTSRRRLYVCSHRTLLDPVFISTALQRRVSAVTYSLSRLSELISPIPTTRLTRDRSRDDAAMRALLRRGDLVVCPEGTTCREPYLLRFSPLFTEITEDIVPVAVTAEGSMFYGTTVRGYKCLDSFFFLMNPRPLYQMLFLDHHQHHHSNGDNNSSSSYEIANRVQRSIGHALGFECTNLTRKDKYRALAGTDGIDLRCFTRTNK